MLKKNNNQENQKPIVETIMKGAIGLSLVFIPIRSHAFYDYHPILPYDVIKENKIEKIIELILAQNKAKH